MTQQITGTAFKEMIINAAAAIDQHRNLINELNVFPVPDGDTGTNMSLTMFAGSTELKKSTPGTVGRASEITAAALLRGARGNSGVILSLLFRGIARHLKDVDSADSKTFAGAMSDGVIAAYKAVMKPSEGTILTVSRLAAAEAVLAAETESDVELVLERAIETGYVALADTINQNPVLKKAGVIDAGGKGYIYILEGMLKALRGEKIEVNTETDANGAEKAIFSSFDTGDITFAYCTEFIVGRKTKKDPNMLRDFLDKRGDSIVVVDDDEIIKVHVHANEPGVIITEALTYGPLLTVKIENMHEQHTAKVVDENAADSNSQERIIAAAEKRFGVVSVCAGEGMVEIFRDLGVDGIITGGQTMNPSTEDILKEIDRTPAEIIYVLPNNKNIILAAEQCVKLTDKKVIVIPSKTVPQGISAMLAIDITATEEENTTLLNEAIDKVHTVQVTYAARDSEFDGKSIKAGEYLALLENTLLANEADIAQLFDIVSKSLSEFSPEFITIFYGEDVDESAANAVLNKFSADIPGAETTLVYGGQPVYYYMISAE